MSRQRTRRRLPRTSGRIGMRGFTLLELMVVVVIIGIVIAGAILTLGSTGRDRGLEQERDRLSALIDYVRDRGAMMSTEYGVLCGQHGYRFVYYDNRSMQWLPETLDDTLRERQLPSGLDLQLSVEGRPIVLDDAILKVTAPGTLGLGAGAANAGTTASATAGPGATSLGSAGTAAAASAAAGPGAADSQASLSPDGPGVQTNAPQILLLSNGDTNSFQLTIERAAAKRSVSFKSSGDGTINAGDIVEAAR